MKRAYKVVDVFTSRPLLGNPVAVILDADALTTEQMQAIANWTNLSETTFVLPPTDAGADYRIRIFTPRSELPFAGHPTLGSAHALLDSGRVRPRSKGRLVQQCDMGLVELTISGHSEKAQLSFQLPSAKIRPLQRSHMVELQAILGGRFVKESAPSSVDVGPVWIVAQMVDAMTLLNLQPDFARLAEFERRLGVTGVTVFAKRFHGNTAIEVRTFAPSCGVQEDPVCGSGNGSVAVFQWKNGLLPISGGEYVASQGRSINRDGRVHVRIDEDGRVFLGGECVTCVHGELTI
jgi:PhzF family phenazine biosynthesis protein